MKNIKVLEEVLGKYILFIYDKDGTLTNTKDGSPAPNSSENMVLLPNVKETLTVIHNIGCIIGLATNQGGVSHGFLSREEAIGVTTVLNQWLNNIISFVEINFYHPEGKHKEKYVDKRKPKPIMLLNIMKNADTLKESTIYIGNDDKDKETAENAGIQFQFAHEHFGWDKSKLEYKNGIYNYID